MMRRWIIGGVVALTTLALGTLFTIAVLSGTRTTASNVGALRPSSGPYRGSEPPQGIPMPKFSLRDEAGRVLDSRELRGKVVLLTFLDSRCTDACPIIASQIAQTLSHLTRAERSQVEAVAISSDPVTDTPAAVHTFLAKQHAVGNLHYLGAGQPLRRLKPVWRAFQILASAETGQHTLHSAPLRIYDRNGIWVTTLHAGADLTPTNLTHDARTALARSR